MSLTWQAWAAVSEGSTTPGAPIAAVPWGDTYALFLSDPHGGVYGIKATPGFGWENVPGLTSTPGAPITTLATGSEFVLFVTNAGGEVFTTTGAPYKGWSAWVSVSQGSTTPGAPVAAVPWGDTYALFLSDPHGGIYGIKATPGFGWENVPGLTSTPGAPITALATGSEFVLFVTNAGGEVFTTTGAPYKGRSAWVSVSQGSTTPGAPVAAVPWGDTYALFLSDPHGGIYGIKATPGFGWENVPGLTSTPGAPITALSWFQPPISDPDFANIPILLFTTNADGEVASTSGLPYQGWQPWSIVAPAGDRVAPSGAVVTVAWEIFGVAPFSVYVANPGGEVFATTSGAPPAMPQLTVTGVTESTISLAWTEAAATTAPLTGFSLAIEHDLGNGSGPTSIAVKSPNDRSAVYTGLDANAKYNFSLAAYSDNGYSPIAKTSTTTLPVVTPPPPVPFIRCSIGVADSLGDKVLDISGSGFENNELVTLQITIGYSDGSVNVMADTTQADAFGNISFTMDVDEYCTSTSTLSNRFTVQGTGESHRVSNASETSCIA